MLATAKLSAKPTDEVGFPTKLIFAIGSTYKLVILKKTKGK